MGASEDASGERVRTMRRKWLSIMFTAVLWAGVCIGFSFRGSFELWKNPNVPLWFAVLVSGTLLGTAVIPSLALIMAVNGQTRLNQYPRTSHDADQAHKNK